MVFSFTKYIKIKNTNYTHKTNNPVLLLSFLFYILELVFYTILCAKLIHIFLFIYVVYIFYRTKLIFYW